MYNAAQFFSGNGYRSWEEMHRDGERKQAAVTIAVDGVDYVLTDKVPKKPEEWRSVVAVVVNGKAWQFKDYPFKVCVCVFLGRGVGVLGGCHSSSCVGMCFPWMCGVYVMQDGWYFNDLVYLATSCVFIAGCQQG